MEKGAREKGKGGEWGDATSPRASERGRFHLTVLWGGFLRTGLGGWGSVQWSVKGEQGVAEGVLGLKVWA